MVPAGIVFDPFPAYDIEISLQYYIYAISQHLIAMVLMFIISNTTAKVGDLFAKLFWVETLSLLDFFIIYEHPFAHIFGYGIEFTDIKLIIYTYLIIRWNILQR